LVFILGILIGAGGVRFYMQERLDRDKSSYKNENYKKVLEVLDKQAAGKEKNNKKVLEFLENKDKVTNNDIEKLLGISNATAERYLDELEKKGVLRQIGKTGHYTYYVKNF